MHCLLCLCICPGHGHSRLTLALASNFWETIHLQEESSLSLFSAHRYCFRVGKIPFACLGAGGAGGGKPSENNMFSFVHAVFQILLLLFLKTKWLLCITSQFVILSRSQAPRARMGARQGELGEMWWYWGGSHPLSRRNAYLPERGGWDIGRPGSRSHPAP